MLAGAAFRSETGEEYVRASRPTNASRLGEVALVDGTSRVGQIGHIFFNTLFDENATCHIAYGRGFVQGSDGAVELDEEAQQEAGVNQSTVHTDCTIGPARVRRRRSDATGEAVRSSGTTTGSSTGGRSRKILARL